MTEKENKNVQQKTLLGFKTIPLYSWFSHDVTKIRTTKLLILLRFHFNDV